MCTLRCIKIDLIATNLSNKKKLCMCIMLEKEIVAYLSSSWQVVYV